MNSSVSVYLRAARLFSLPLSLLPVWVAFAIVDTPGHWYWSRLVAVLLGVTLLHITGNLLNDYFDFLQNVDRKMDESPQRPGRLLLRGEITPHQVFTEAIVCLVIGIAPLVYLLFQCGWGVFLFATIAALGLYSYTGPPLTLKYRAMGEPLIFLLFGPVLMLGAGFVQTGRLEGNILLLSLPVGLANTAVLLGNNLRDRQEDRQAGIRTLPILLGEKGSGVFMGLVALAALLPAVFVFILPNLPMGLLFCPMSLIAAFTPLKAVTQRRPSPDIDLKIAQFSTLLSGIILGAFLLHGNL